MEQAKPLPGYLVQRYHGWKATGYKENQSWYRHLAHGGQHPRAMVISCCDSRVHASSIFGADEGELFIHRNIASLVPPYEPDGDPHGTSAAVEYAVTLLNVAHVIVIGHSGCGGIKGCIDMCQGNAAGLEEKNSFIGRWLDILKPSYPLVASENDPYLQAQALEKQSVLVSLQNLMSFPFVKSRVSGGMLTLHGLWTDIGEGGLEFFDAQDQAFHPV